MKGLLIGWQELRCHQTCSLVIGMPHFAHHAACEEIWAIRSQNHQGPPAQSNPMASPCMNGRIQACSIGTACEPSCSTFAHHSSGPCQPHHLQIYIAHASSQITSGCLEKGQWQHAMHAECSHGQHEAFLCMCSSIIGASQSQSLEFGMALTLGCKGASTSSSCILKSLKFYYRGLRFL